MSIVCPTCPLDFHHFPGVISVPLTPHAQGYNSECTVSIIV